VDQRYPGSLANASITSVTRSCRIAFYNICRTWPFLIREEAQVLVQALIITCLDYSLLAGLPASANKSLQRIQNAAARLMFNLPELSHLTPLFCDLHFLPVIARIRFKTLVLAYKAVSGTAPTYRQTLVRPHAPARALCSTTLARRLVPPSLSTGKHRSAKS